MLRGSGQPEQAGGASGRNGLFIVAETAGSCAAPETWQDYPCTSRPVVCAANLGLWRCPVSPDLLTVWSRGQAAWPTKCSPFWRNSRAFSKPSRQALKSQGHGESQCGQKQHPHLPESWVRKDTGKKWVAGEDLTPLASSKHMCSVGWFPSACPCPPLQ